MKKEKIEKLFETHSIPDGICWCGETDNCTCNIDKIMYLENFAKAINRAEIEWYRKLDSKLDDLTDCDSVRRLLDAINRYQAEIQNKLKEINYE